MEVCFYFNKKQILFLFSKFTEYILVQLTLPTKINNILHINKLKNWSEDSDQLME